MIISTQTRYAVRLLLELAAVEDITTPTRLSYIAERQGISERYLEAIAVKLRKSGYLKSFKGTGGGYCLAQSLDEISLGEIMRLMESTYFEVHCVDNAETECANYEECRIAGAWAALEGHISSVVDGIYLSQLSTPGETEKHLPKPF